MPNYLVPAILTTLFCCLPLGIVSIVFAAQVNGKLEAGDRAGALDSSRKARMWAWISFGTGLVLIAGSVVLVVVLGVAGEAGGTY
ncbi:MAG: CD225/dispanin family protein [Actinobacteria bacterium]|nr:CD225/dispanin family protein [Actinomycetota bacterium]